MAPNEEVLKTPHYYQLADVTAVKQAPLHRWIIAHDMGVGKTASAILAARDAIQAQRVLVACPAVVRSNWIRELRIWWPGHPASAVITEGRSRSLSKPKQEARALAYASPIQVVSYDLLDQIETAPWDLIVLDELHRCKNAGAHCHQAARAICEANPGAAILGLTGTLIPDQIPDLWAQLDLIWPGRFGKPDKNGKHSWQFKDRYCNKRHNGYGWEFEGAKEAYLPELRRRLAAVATRVTKAEIAHLLPPFSVDIIRVPARAWKPPVTSDVASLQYALETAAVQKVPHVVEWAEDASESASHICILTHLRETAEVISEKLRTKFGMVYCITGDMPPEQRVEGLAYAKASPRGIIVATMHSVGIGIDLSWCTQALFAELYWRPETMLQAAGRFPRLSGTAPTSIWFMVLEGTIDERVADNLLGKFTIINGAIKPGGADSQIQTALSAAANDDQEFLASLLQYATPIAANDDTL